jgi:hypothetical protein
MIPATTPLPDAHDPVTLIMASGDQVPAQVRKLHSDSVEFVVMIRTAPFTTQQLDGLSVEFTIPQGHVRMQGNFGCDDPQAPEVVRLTDPRVIEFDRQDPFAPVTVSCPVQLLPTALKTEPIAAHTVTLGLGGAVLDTPPIFKPGQRLQFEITVVPWEPPVCGSGRVSDSGAPAHTAVVFDRIEPADRQRLRAFVAASRPRSKAGRA